MHLGEDKSIDNINNKPNISIINDTHFKIKVNGDIQVGKETIILLISLQ
jgi:hypothetical protein